MFFVAALRDDGVHMGQFDEVKETSLEEKVWVDVSNYTEDDLKKLAQEFDLHPLTIEDINGSGVRIKLEEFRGYTYFHGKGVTLDGKKRKGFSELNIVIGKNFILTVSKQKRKAFEILKNNKKKLESLFEKGSGLEYVAHHLIDMEVDAYFPYLDNMERHLNRFEDDVLVSDQEQLLAPIFRLKKEIVDTKRIVSSMREVARLLATRDVKFIDIDSQIYFNDIHDHLVRISEVVDGFRDLVNSTLEIQLATSSYRTNDIVRILTIITTLFMPLTFITGLYGMNFSIMPELEWRFGYPVVLLAMLLIEVAMIVYFKRKRWI